MITKQNLIIGIVIIVCLTKAHEMTPENFCSLIPFDKLDPGTTTNDTVGWSYNCKSSTCVKVKVPPGSQGSHNFWSRQDFCQYSCPGNIQCFSGKRQLNKYKYCMGAVIPIRNKTVGKCNGSTTIWSYSSANGSCYPTELNCNQMLKKNSFTRMDDCEQICDFD